MNELEQKIYDTIIDTIKLLELDIVRLRMTDGGNAISSKRILEILIERLNGKPVSIGDCRTASYNVSAILDVEDIIAHEYNLEVSSTGIERPLVKLRDFDRFKGSVAQIKLSKAISNMKKFEGKLMGLEDNNVLLELPKTKTEPSSIMKIDFDNIKDAKLVLTEELFRKIIK